VIEAYDAETVTVAGHEFAWSVDTDGTVDVRYREIASLLDEAGRDSALADRIRQEARAAGGDPEEAIVNHPEDMARLDERVFDLQEQVAEQAARASSTLRERYDWPASTVAELSDEELVDALAIEVHYDPAADVDVDIEAAERRPTEAVD